MKHQNSRGAGGAEGGANQTGPRVLFPENSKSDIFLLMWGKSVITTFGPSDVVTTCQSHKNKFLSAAVRSKMWKKTVWHTYLSLCKSSQASC